ALPTRQISLATLAVAVPFGATITLDSDILDSFVERITLAVENASLYRTLADRSHDLQRAYSDLATAHQELLSVDEMKTNFLANVSHELRTPLTSIRSFSELLLAYEDDPTVQNEFLQIISTESERLTRLLNDAMKFTRPGGTILLRGQLVEGEVLVSVCDTGIGVAPADQERIFEKFQQVGDTLTDKPRGTGLGLAICRDIVEHHQGRMWVESTPGHGSAFTVALPNESSALARAA